MAHRDRAWKPNPAAPVSPAAVSAANWESWKPPRCPAAIRLFFGRWRPVQFAIPIVAIILLGYSLYGNVYPVPALPAAIFPYIVLGWILAGVIVSLLFPQRLRQVAADLADEAS
jgi:hypothetical protein